MWKKLLAVGLSLFSALAMAAVDVNSATAADLDSVKGIGPGTSSKILDARKAGAFKDWNDLIQRVSGIGPARANKLSEQGLRVNGAAFETPAAAKPASLKPVAAKPAPAAAAAAPAPAAEPKPAPAAR